MAAVTIATTTDVNGVVTGAHPHCNKANGYYWAFFDDGTTGKAYNSTDKSSWNAKGNMFAQATTRLHAIRFDGSKLHISGIRTTGVGVYHQATLGLLGVISWQTQVEPTGAATADHPDVGFDSSNYPWYCDDAEACTWYRNAQTDGQGAWTAYDNTDDGASDSFPHKIFDLAVQDMIDLHWRTNTGNNPGHLT